MLQRVHALALAILLGSASMVRAQDDLARELPRIPAKEPAEALASIVVRPGFRLDQVAAEPLIKSPVAVAYDADGALYVVEMRGYPFVEDKPSGTVARLEDRDGDGRFDARTVFLDGLMWPTGVVPYDGGVFITVAPDILYAKDTDGDGKAEVRKVVFTGFETGNVQGLLNSLHWGDDGWIHGVASSNGGLVRTPPHPDRPAVSVRGRDFRFRPDTLAFEAISGGGQFGFSTDDWGHEFTCGNSNHIRQIVLPAGDVERNPAYVPPSVILDIPSDGPSGPVFRISRPEPWRIVRTRQRVADPEMLKKLSHTEQFAFGYFTSATGVTIYRGSAYPEAYRGNAFVGDVGGNLVHRKTLAVAGATYVADRADQGVEFLASKDNWFRPVNFANTPNGTLLVVDMYRETIEHPISIPEPIKKHLDLTSGKDRGRLYELLADGPRPLRKPRLSKAPAAELVALLADSDAWWSETAQRLLIERKDVQAAPALRKLAQDRPTALARLHALWTLDALGQLDDAHVAMALADPEPRVRERVAKLAESRIKADRALIANVLPLADDVDPMVRFQAALTFGAVNDDPRVLDALAVIARRDHADRWTRAAVLTSIAGHAPDLLARLAEGGFLGEAEGRPWLDDLATMIGQAKDGQAIEKVVADLFAKELSDDLRGRVVLAVGAGLKRARGSLKETLSAATWDRLGPLFDAAAKVADSGEAPARRASAIALVGLSGPERTLEALPPLLDARQPSEVQLAALRALGEQAGPAVAERVLEQWKATSPSARREAAEVLFSRIEWINALLDAVEAKKLATAEIDPLRLKQLREHPDSAIRGRAARLFGSADAPRERAAVIAAFRPALDGEGDREKGRAVYLKTCATCHRAEGQGVEVGPDLATVAARSPEDVLTHVLDPNREVAANYLNYNVATVDGRVISGIIASESTAALVLKRAEGVAEVVPRDQIEQIASTGISLMPEGLEKDLTSADFKDLIAFVRSIRSASPAPAPATAPK
ncbi:PVC-type heme-binding CxxCH protein [Paludisphaera mucosa]|uniref:C-type cytochrome n=1 Tax=Paludisphaera mucosa TaxID=3030827 RepID=A0ABT6F516_9BACT|nr:PVC-type heme-binding CxxCH protein [Paludisphaera mucosa]MDG3002677.1 c-type cytochrome [Paludisphaera mucosa]